MNFTRGLQEAVAGSNVIVQLVIPAVDATGIWDKGGFPLSALDEATIMTAEDCVDAALAGLDQGETSRANSSLVTGSIAPHTQ